MEIRQNETQGNVLFNDETQGNVLFKDETQGNVLFKDELSKCDHSQQHRGSVYGNKTKRNSRKCFI